MSGFGRKADVHVGQFCENLGDIPECPLFSIAVVQITEKSRRRQAGNGQERSFGLKKAVTPLKNTSCA